MTLKMSPSGLPRSIYQALEWPRGGVHSQLSIQGSDATRYAVAVLNFQMMAMADGMGGVGLNGAVMDLQASIWVSTVSLKKP